MDYSNIHNVLKLENYKLNVTSFITGTKMDNELAKRIVDYNYIPNLKIASRPFIIKDVKFVKSTNIQSYSIKYL